MGNVFAHLRHNPKVRFRREKRHEQRNYEVVDIAQSGDSYVRVLIGRMKGVWVGGYHYHVGHEAGFATPSIELGWFERRQDVMLYFIGEMLDTLRPFGPIKRQMLERLHEARQLSLF